MSLAQISIRSISEKLFALNSPTEYVVGITLIVISVIIIKLVQRFLKKKLERLTNDFARYMLRLTHYAYPLLYVAIIFLVFSYYTVTPKVSQIAGYAFKVAFIILCIRLLVGGLRAAFYSYLNRHDESGEKTKQVKGIVLILSGVVWLLGLIFMFDNLGFNVTAVLTGLGVGGIAIALAAQTILGDLFNYFVIFFDRPFEIGDFIIVDDKMGTVEYIGLKTTRIRSLGGEQIIFSNTNLTNSRVHNYKRMQERRVLFKIRIVYETGSNTLETIPSLIRTIIEQQHDTRFDRAHFASFDEYWLNFEVVYYILSADYNRYMDVQQQINLRIVEVFEQQEIRFALPTYSIKWKPTSTTPDGNIASIAKNDFQYK
jgi:small-conductance mechanosensitive channel